MSDKVTINTLDNGNISIRVPLIIKYKHGCKKIIAPEALDGANPGPESPVQDALVNALARAHSWMEAIESGKVQNVKHLAETLGLDCSYVARILRLINLAPDIQEAILNGEEPSGLSLEKLRCVIPEDWQEQREVLFESY